jgi:hypothetical protein
VCKVLEAALLVARLKASGVRPAPTEGRLGSGGGAALSAPQSPRREPARGSAAPTTVSAAPLYCVQPPPRPAATLCCPEPSFPQINPIRPGVTR